MSSPRIPRRRGRKPGKNVLYYECSVCQYTSQRYYNVTRHEIRIHSASSKRRQCCGISFATKGEYYLHCEEFHPYARASNLMSRTKYKIFPGADIVKRIKFEIFETSDESTEGKLTRAPYMMRPRAKTSTASNSQYNESESDDSLDDLPAKSNNALEQRSSGYGTQNSSLDINENEFRSENWTTESSTTSENSIELKQSSSEDLDESTDQTSKVGSSSLHLETRGCSSIASDNSDTSHYPISQDENEEESRENIVPRYVGTPVSYDLPIKKRILRSIAITYERKNIETFRGSIVDRLYHRIKSEETVSARKRRRLTRKIKKRKIMPRDTSSDTENTPITPNVDEDSTEKHVNQCNVEVRADPSIIWHDFTIHQREYLTAIDFDSFKYSLK